MELRQLNSFLVLCGTLNFSEASKHLFITQGTLSQQISMLEQELGTKLFQRTSRRVRLTQAGERLLPLARKTVESSHECFAAMRDVGQGLCGTLRIGAAYCFDTYIVSAVKAFRKEHPGVHLVITRRRASELLDMLRRDELDLVLAFKPVTNCDDMECNTLFSTRLTAIMRSSHFLASQDEVSMEDIARCPVILPGSGYDSRKCFDDFAGIDPSVFDVKIEADDPQLVLDLVSATGHVAVMAPVGLDDFCSRRPLKALPIANLDSEMSCCTFVMRRAMAMASRDAFLEILKENM